MKSIRLFPVMLVLLSTSSASLQAQAIQIPGQAPTREQGDEFVAQVLGRKIMAYEREQLHSMIVVSLLEEYVKENKIYPTDEEILAFLVKDEQMQAESKVEWERDKKKLQQELASGSISAEDKAKKEADLKSIEDRLKGPPVDPEGGVKMRTMLRDMAVQMVSRWKVNSSLYKKYGGRVVFQQGGPEPLDAYVAFLKEQESNGKFRFANEEDKKAFWSYFINQDKHQFLPQEEGTKLMTTPWWLMEKQPQK